MSRFLVMEHPGARLIMRERAVPSPGPGQVCLAVEACGVCRTDLHVLDGELAFPGQPVIPGHEIVGHVVGVGPGVDVQAGTRLGVAWLGSTCGHCSYCASGAENLCDTPLFTGWQLPGGYADHVVADFRYCYPLPVDADAAHLAPLLCAGFIGWRALKFAGPGQRLGLYGFGAAAHLVIQVARHEGRDVYVFTRPDDRPAAALAEELGARWVGPSTEPAPEALDAAIIFAPVGPLVPLALQATRKGGTVVCAGIHMSDIPSFPYNRLWGERVLRSVANLTRADGLELLALADRVPLRTTVQLHPLAAANDALDRLRRGAVQGAAVLVP
jgi:alcohol dehydrogenase, propanol-preferring